MEDPLLFRLETYSTCGNQLEIAAFSERIAIMLVAIFAALAWFAN